MYELDCPFCLEEATITSPDTSTGGVIWRGHFCYVKYDAHAVTKHHCLVIPYAHVESYFDLALRERQEMDKALFWAKTYLEALDDTIASFNMGINDGEQAGQTIPHCHIHLIPRRLGDTVNPRGGIRGVIPEKQDY